MFFVRLWCSAIHLAFVEVIDVPKIKFTVQRCAPEVVQAGGVVIGREAVILGYGLQHLAAFFIAEGTLAERVMNVRRPECDEQPFRPRAP